MDRNETEVFTSKIRQTMNQTSPPVDIFHIAREEGILLAPGHYGEEFDGRIEFHPRKGKFILFYPEPSSTRLQTRIRFSVAHELGHYYIPEHRELLVRGQAHNSISDFLCDNMLEREADFFAASLLLPADVLADFCDRKKFFTLKEIVELAKTWQTSATSAAIRYVEWTYECCAIVLSQDELVRFYIASEDAAYRGFQWLGKKKVAPRSATIEAGKQRGSGQFFEQQSHTEMWFSDRSATLKLWEEAFPLGYTGRVLTMLTFEVEDLDE